MYAFTARFHAFEGHEAPGGAPDIARQLRSTAEPDDGLEHIYTQATPFGVYAVLFMNGPGARAAEDAAVEVCREALRRGELRGWDFTWQGPERALNAAASW
ncbi:hypothetical protein GCM10027168_22990 [Streptomyces capparidis]